MKKETKYFMINYTNNDVNYIDDVCIYLEKEAGYILEDKILDISSMRLEYQYRH